MVTTKILLDTNKEIKTDRHIEKNLNYFYFFPSSVKVRNLVFTFSNLITTTVTTDHSLAQREAESFCNEQLRPVSHSATLPSTTCRNTYLLLLLQCRFHSTPAGKVLRNDSATTSSKTDSSRRSFFFFLGTLNSPKTNWKTHLIHCSLFSCSCPMKTLFLSSISLFS